MGYILTLQEIDGMAPLLQYQGFTHFMAYNLIASITASFFEETFEMRINLKTSVKSWNEFTVIHLNNFYNKDK
jgi:hypothetical protein